VRVLPSIDLSLGKVVKRVRGVRGTGLVVGEAVRVAEEFYELGYDSIHIVDLDAAEGLGSNEDLIKDVVKVGFKWVQVGGGIRDISKAIRLLSYGATAVVVSTMFYISRNTFEELLRVVGGDKVLVAVDYDNSLTVRVRGWREGSVGIDEALNAVSSYDVLGVIFTYIDSEGTEGSVDKRVTNFVGMVKGLKEYAGGISTVDDLLFLKGIGIDYAIVGMAMYRGALLGVKYV
jgi:phosphoribosylformimino-5-aminoimidazole carboxamide ribotide isomerase